MHWRIRHTTRYTYAAPVRDSFNEVRLQPFSNANQAVEAFQLAKKCVAMRVATDAFRARAPEVCAELDGVGRDYANVPPVSGTYNGTTGRSMQVQVNIQQIT